MTVGWNVAELDFQELVKCVADAFCRSRKIDMTKHRVRVGLHINEGGETLSCTVKWRETEEHG